MSFVKLDQSESRALIVTEWMEFDIARAMVWHAIEELDLTENRQHLKHLECVSWFRENQGVW